MHRQIPHIISVLFRVVCLAQDSDLHEQLDAVLCTMCLLTVEVGHDETLIELFRLAFGMQAMAVDTTICHFSFIKRAEIHNLVAKFLNLSTKLLADPHLINHVNEIINRRAGANAHPKLNIKKTAEPIKDPLTAPMPNGKAPIAHMESVDETPRHLEMDDLLFDLKHFCDVLSEAKKDIIRLMIPFRPTSVPGVSTAAVDAAIGISNDNQASEMPPLIIGSGSSVIFTASGDEPDIIDRRDELQRLDDDIKSLSSSSIDWTPPASAVTSRRNTIFGAPNGKVSTLGPTTIETLRMELNQPIDIGEEDRKDQAKSREIVQMFRERPLDELSAMLVKDLEETDLNRTIDSLCKRNTEWAKIQEFGAAGKSKTIFDIKFPDFVK